MDKSNLPLIYFIFLNMRKIYEYTIVLVEIWITNNVIMQFIYTYIIQRQRNHNTIKFVMTFNHVYYKTFLPCIITRFDNV